MAPPFCSLMHNDPHVALQIERYFAFRWFEDIDQQSLDLNEIWKAKHALGCPQCARYRKHGNNSLCNRCQKLGRIIRRIESEISAQIPNMLLKWREENLSVEAHKVYKRASELATLSHYILRRGLG